MDVMKPDLEWIEGKCYRKNAVDKSNVNNAVYEEDVDDDSEQDNDVDTEPTVCEDIADYDIQTMKNGQFRTQFHVASAYYGLLIGFKGSAKKRIENETRTRISIPKMGQEGEIVITGDTIQHVSSARTRIEMMVMAARQKKDFTHFLSFCLASEEVKNGFNTFKELVLSECSDCRGVDASLFQKPEKLHLTLTTTVLMSDIERARCADLLKECVETVVRPMVNEKPLVLRVEGIEYMNDDPAEVDVLYGKVIHEENADVLQDISDSVVDFFVRKGEVKRQYDMVKLHATVMNTLFRSNAEEVLQATDSRQSRKQRDTFDARKILDRFENYYFGRATVDNIQLSERYTTDSNNGYYKSTAKVYLSTR